MADPAPPSPRRGSSCSRRSATTPATRSTSSWPAPRRRWPPPRSPRRLGLHPNTVRPHLERMREVGLLEVVTDAQGTVGPPAAPLLARRRRPVARLRAAGVPRAGPDAAAAGRRAPSCPAADAVEAGREQGAAAADRRAGAGTCAEALTAELAALGFDPESVVDERRRHDRLHPLPVPRAGRGQPRPRVQPPPRAGRGLRRASAATAEVRRVPRSGRSHALPGRDRAAAPVACRRPTRSRRRPHP